MDNKPTDSSSEIKPISELGVDQDAPTNEQVQNPSPPPNPPGNEQTALSGQTQSIQQPSVASSSPPSIESLAAEPFPEEEKNEIVQPKPIEQSPKASPQPEAIVSAPPVAQEVPVKPEIAELEPEPTAKPPQAFPSAPLPPPTAPPPPRGYVPPQAPSPPPGYTPPQQKLSVAPPTDKIGRGAVIQRGAGGIWTIIIVLIIALLLLAGTFFLFFYRATINISPTPAADTITLDGKAISPGKVKVMPGEHSLIVKKSGYISLNLSRDFKINQKLDLSALELKKAIVPEVVAVGAKHPVLSGDGLQVNFTSSDGHLLTFPVQRQGKTYTISPLSVGTYSSIRELIYAKDNGFAFILDTQALKVIDFKKTNLVDQLEAILPPDPAKIHSFTTNEIQSESFGTPNSQIIYDFKTDYDWFLYLADSEHKQSQILMQIEPNVFTSMSLDWGQNARQVLLLGGSAGIYDLPTRSFERISEETGFASGSWGPQAQYAVALKATGELYVLKNSALEDIGISVQNNAFSWVSPNEVVAQTENGPVRVNFDTGSVINYAEIAGLQNSSFIAVSGNTIFFSDAEGLKTATLQENYYGV